MINRFCPKECLFPDVPVMCTVDCEIGRIQVFKTPEPIKIKGGCGVEPALIVGRVGDKLYVEQKNLVSTINVRSPLIK